MDYQFLVDAGIISPKKKERVEDDTLILSGLTSPTKDEYDDTTCQQEEDPQPSKKKRKASSAGGFKKKKKKKPKAIKMTNFFQTRKNFQGFDMHLCRYEPSIKDHVYVPKCHEEVAKARPWVERKFCCSCKLQPCIMETHLEEITHKWLDEWNVHKKAIEEGRRVKAMTPVNRLEKFILSLLTKCFGRNYMKENGTPDCVVKQVCDYYEWKKNEDAEESEDDSEEDDEERELDEEDDDGFD